jgi:hypothetical protein
MLYVVHSLSQQFYSQLAPDALLATVQAATLPLANPSWHDNFVADAAQPFQGVVSASGFCITRLSTGQARRAAPLPLTGYITANQTLTTSNRLEIRLHLSLLARILNAASWLLALLLMTASLLQEKHGLNFSSIGGVLFLLVPAGLTVAQQTQLQREAAIYVQLLGPLLGLTKQPSI